MPNGHEALAQALLHEWPRYLGYLVSFAFIGGVWIAHSNMTRFIKAVVFYLAVSIVFIIEPLRRVRIGAVFGILTWLIAIAAVIIIGVVAGVVWESRSNGSRTT